MSDSSYSVTRVWRTGSYGLSAALWDVPKKRCRLGSPPARGFLLYKAQRVQILASLGPPFKRARRDLSNAVSFAQFEAVLEEIHASK